MRASERRWRRNWPILDLAALAIKRQICRLIRSLRPMLNVSERSVRDATVVRDRGEPELRDALDRGKIAVNAARLLAKKQREIADKAFKGDMNAVRNVVKAETRKVKEADLGAKQTALPKRKYGVILADPEWRFEP
jgi:hypothetical protein